MYESRIWAFSIVLALFVGETRNFAASCFNAPSGMIGWWAAEGNANTLVGTNNGSLQGTATASAAGEVGTAFSFDGTNGSVQIPDATVLHPTNLTIEAWVRFTGLDSAASGGSPAGAQYIVFKQNSRSGNFEGFDLQKTRSGSNDFFQFIVTSSGGVSAQATSTTAISTGVWYHVAAVRGTNFVQIYVNGQLQQQVTATFAQDYGTLPVFFGTSGNSSWDHKLKGALDEVSLYNRALSSNEIVAIYNAGTSGKCKAVNIVTQPASQELPTGTNATFTVVATGLAPLSYQWSFGGSSVNLATNSSLTLASIQASNGGDYSVVVSNVFGSVTSAVATLIVDAPIIISAQPQSRTNIANTSATFSVTATGNPSPTYQWRFNNGAISGATNSTFTINAVQLSDAGGYSVVLTNAFGSLTSSVATLTVWVPPSIALQPQSVTNVINTTANFSVTANGTPAVAYQWQFNGAPIANATGSAFSVASVQPNNGGNYAVVITNSAGSITSSVAALTVWVPPSITAQPQSATNIVNTTANFSVTASGTPAVAYQWQFNGAPIANATGSAFSIASVQPSNGGNYTVVVTNSAGSITSSVATLTVWVPPSISVQPQSATNLINTTANFSVTANGTPGPAYQWQFNGAPIANATGSAFSIASVQPSNGGNYAVVVTNSAGSITSSVATLTVWVPPSITAQPQSATNIVNATANFSVTASGTPGPAYQWQFNGAPIANATGSAFSIANVQPSNGGNYAVVITNSAGSITSTVATLTVWVPPSISAQPQSATNIVNTTANFSVTASGTPGPEYQWQFNGAPIANATGSAFSIASVQPSNGGNYTVVVTNSAGSITSSVATLTVWAPPAITLQPQSLTNIINTAANFSVTATGTPAVAYQWQFNGAPIANATGSAFSIASVQPTNAGNYAVVITNSAGSITSTVATLTVWVPPSISVQPQSATNIINTTANFSVTASGTPAPAYQWQFNGTPIANATTSTFSIASVQPGDGGNYAVAIANLAGSITSSIAALTVWVPPSISVQPQSATNIVNTTANLSVTASGAPAPAYQWQFNGSPLANATASALTIPNVQTNQAGIYSVVITNSAASVTSAVATLTVWVPPSILVPPQSQTVYVGTNVTFSLTAIGTAPLQYQWRLNGTDLQGATGTALTFTNVQLSNAGSYTVFITNVAAGVTSAPAILNVVQPDAVIFCDPNLEDAVRQHLAKPVGSINRLDMRGLTMLRASELHITCLGGLEWATNLTSIELGGNLVSDVTIFTNLTQLTNASLYRNMITNVSPLAKLQNASALDIRWNTNLTDFSPLTSLTNLNVLYLGGNGVSNASWVSALSGLTFLDLDGTSVTNLSSLALLTHLNGLDVGYVANFNVSSVSGLTNLQTLYASGDSITNLSFLNNLVGLTNLCLYGNAMTDVSPLQALYNLRSLNIGGNPSIASFDSLSSLTNLESLWVHGNALTTISFVQPLNRLAYLTADANSITNTAPLAALSQAVILSLKNNQISDASAFVGLANLSALNLSGNQIATAQLPTGLRCLDLSANQLKSLIGVSTLTNLNFLSAGANPLTNSAGVSSLTGLSTLFLFSAGVSNLTPLQNLAALQTLDLRKNGIVNVTPLQSLTNLQSLNLSSNLISSAASLSVLSNLTVLDMSSNSVTDWAFLNSFSNLASLTVQGCALADLSLTIPLPRLGFLDATLNRITNVSVLGALTNLHQFIGACNRSRDLSIFSGMPRLWKADLRTNLLDLTDSTQLNAIQSLTNRLVTVQVLPQNQPPSIVISNFWPVAVNTTSSPSYFTIADDVTPPSQLALNASSSNPSLIANSGIQFVATATNRYVTFTPVAGQTGTSQVTITVTDDTGLSTNVIVQVAVVVQQTVTVPDAGLAAIIRSVLSKPTGALNNLDMLKLTQLVLDNSSISNLTGLEFATNLVGLSAGTNRISSVAPLQGLPQLQILTLDRNATADFTPISTLSNLVSLSLDWNSISNISFVSSLSHLVALSASGNFVSDLSPLASLNNLTSLSLDQNVLTNISILPSLPALAFVDVSINKLNIAAGSPAMNVITTLLSRPVSVFYTPQRTPPSLVVPARWLIGQGSPSTLAVTVYDSYPVPSAYTLTATPGDPTLLPATNFSLFYQSSFGWGISALPVAGKSGTTTVKLVINDIWGLSSTSSLPVTVSAQTLGAQILGNSNFAASSWGNAVWFNENTNTYSGVSAAQSGHVLDLQNSWLGLTLIGPGRLTYWSKVSSEPDYDFLDFFINGQIQTNRLSGTNSVWQRFIFNIPAGTNLVAWRYQKDPDTAVAMDAGWVDSVQFDAGVWLELISAPWQGQGQAQMLLHGVPGISYEVQSSSNFLNWSRVKLLTPTDTSTLVIDTNVVSGMRVYRMHQFP